MIKELGLDVKAYDLNLLSDERGFFIEILRKDWKDFLDEWVVQANLSYSRKGVIRAWHRHLQGQVDYFLVLKGAIKVCVYDPETRKLIEVVLDEKKPLLLKVPGKYWHGTKAIEPSLTIYFVTRLYNYENPDEERIPWNDKSIVPLEINGNKDDPRVGKPWDWFYPPHK